MEFFEAIRGTLHGVHTIVLLFVFLGICAWAYSARRSKANDEAANLPFADEDIDQRTLKESEKKDD